MKRRIIVCAFFAIIVSAAGAARAQHVKVVDGTRISRAAIYRNLNGVWVQLSADVAVGPAIRAGETIRLRFAATNNRGRLVVGVDNAKLGSAPGNGRLYLATNAGVYQVPCDGTTRLGGVSTAQLTITGTISDATPSWKTDEGWRGTCRMLVMKLNDGRETRAKVRFE